MQVFNVLSSSVHGTELARVVLNGNEISDVSAALSLCLRLDCVAVRWGK